MNTTRRNFLKAGALLSGGIVTSPISMGSEKAERLESSIPKRKIGRSGLETSILTIGGMQTVHSPRFLEMAYREGIRSFDTAKAYLEGRSEKNISDWFKRLPQRRGEIFLSTKQRAVKGGKYPLRLDDIEERCKSLEVDCIDLVYTHALGIGGKEDRKAYYEWLCGDDFRAECKRMRGSGKVKYIGASVHKPEVELMKMILKGGILDVVMVAYNPFTLRGSEMDRVLDSFAEAGIGVICMKTMRSYTNKVGKTNPTCERLGVNFPQAILQSCWSDERILSVCLQMENDEHIRDSVIAANTFSGKYSEELIKELGGYTKRVVANICTGCESCDAIAMEHGGDMHDMARYVSYYENDGNVGAREMYLEAGLDLSGIDLEKARMNCKNHVDYPGIKRRADKYFLA